MIPILDTIEELFCSEPLLWCRRAVGGALKHKLTYLQVYAWRELEFSGRCLLATGAYLLCVSLPRTSKSRKAAQGYSQLCLPLSCSCKPPLAHGCNFTTALPALTASPCIPRQEPHKHRPLQSCCQSANVCHIMHPQECPRQPKSIR